MKAELTKSLNHYLADTGVLYVKLHNLHWNVIGKDFKAVHEYLETLYDGFSDVLDAVAECLKMHDEKPLASLKSYLEVTSIQEIPSEEMYSDSVLAMVKEDIGYMKTQAEQIRAVADEESMYDVVALMEDHLSDYNKTLWFLKAMTK